MNGIVSLLRLKKMKKSAPQIFVINLERSEDRRKNVLKQLDAMEMTYTLFPAVDGKKGHPLFSRYNEKKRVRWKGKVLQAGQLGCFASHYLLWQICVKDQRPMIVIEDDARFMKEQFVSFYNAAKDLPETYECIRLFENHSKNNRFIKVQDMGDFSIAKFTKGHMRTTGYFLTPSGAQKFLNSSEQWFLPVDITMDRFWSNKVECYGVLPVCLDNDPRFESTIALETSQEDPGRAFLIKFKRELFAFAESIRRLIWNIMFRITGK